MNDHDRDLILGLATGSLSETDAAAAQARIDADPQLAAELAEQRAAIDALAAVEPVAMTADERTTLRAELIDQLHLEEAPAAAAVAPATRPARAAWWKPVLGLGAAAVFVTAIVIVPGMIDGSDDAAFDTASAELASTTTIQATGAPQSDEAGESGASLDRGQDGAEEEFTADGSDLLPLIAGRNTTSVTDSLDVAGVDAIDVALERRFEECRAAVADELPADAEIEPIGVSTIDERLIYVAADEGSGISVVATVDLETCSIVDIDR